MARIAYATRDKVPERLKHLYDDMASTGATATMVGEMSHLDPIC